MQEPLAAAAAALVNPAVATEAENQVPLKCPRCDSMNTKFCYYNNYNLSQPRHFCKNCRRYWTKGGALRNVPVGGGTRKNSKRSSSSSSSNATSSTSNPKRLSTSSANSENPIPKPAEILKPEPLSLLYPNPVDDKMLDFTGSFSSLLQSNVQFADINLLDGFDHHHPDHSSSIPDLGNLSRPNEDTSSGNGGGGGDGMLNWANGWPDLAIYTPGSSFQ